VKEVPLKVKDERMAEDFEHDMHHKGYNLTNETLLKRKKGLSPD
ncbi:uncharacterized protein METZ01_LOCUS102773, partial [marine metagenome]|jgi:hypothetical protein|tara:strand:- start:357 stop:488 length:132 start_codon:yes stop_codon:yes gene_type:complete